MSYLVDGVGQHSVADTIKKLSELTPKNRVISVGSKKGGVGKSIIAINLAVGLSIIYPNASIVIIDGDIEESATASVWYKIRSENTNIDNQAENITLTSHAGAIGRFLERQKNAYDFVIVDLPGYSEAGAFSGALKVSDAAILPFQTDMPDLTTFKGLIKPLIGITSQNPNLDITSIITQAVPFAHARDVLVDSKNDLEAANMPSSVQKKLPNYRHLKTAVYSRKSYKTAFEEGRGVLELTGKNHAQAQYEILSLVKEVAL